MFFETLKINSFQLGQKNILNENIAKIILQCFKISIKTYFIREMFSK